MNAPNFFHPQTIALQKNRREVLKIFKFFHHRCFYLVILVGYFQFATFLGSAQAYSLPSNDSARPSNRILLSENIPSETSRGKKKKKKKPRKKIDISENSDQEWAVGFGLSGGFEAPFGNGAVISVKYQENFLGQLGVGYNLSGLKIGAGGDYLWLLNKYFAFPLGLALVRSNGISGSVSIDGTFTSETGESESIQAKRKFSLSPAFYLSPKAGVILKLFDNTDIYIFANYNIIIGGNDVTFTSDITYDQDVAVINEEEAKRQFEEKAAEKVRTGGFGGQLGFNFWF